jgi:hypothetical protein
MGVLIAYPVEKLGLRDVKNGRRPRAPDALRFAGVLVDIFTLRLDERGDLDAVFASTHYAA